MTVLAMWILSKLACISHSRSNTRTKISICHNLTKYDQITLIMRQANTLLSNVYYVIFWKTIHNTDYLRKAYSLTLVYILSKLILTRLTFILWDVYPSWSWPSWHLSKLILTLVDIYIVMSIQMIFNLSCSEPGWFISWLILILTIYLGCYNYIPDQAPLAVQH